MDTITFNFDTNSIRLTVLNIFNYLKNLNSLPKQITCFLPSLNNNYFYDPINNNFFEYAFVKLEKDKDHFAPYDYTKFIGLDWIYYYNLNDIVMLENFCNLANIELKWTIKDRPAENIELVLIEKFKGYFKNENY